MFCNTYVIGQVRRLIKNRTNNALYAACARSRRLNAMNDRPLFNGKTLRTTLTTYNTHYRKILPQSKTE